MFKAKLLIVLMAVGCSLPLAASDSRFFITRTEVYDGQKVLAITGYKGTSRTVIVPVSINGLPVRIISDNAFRLKLLVEVFIPEGIEVIGSWAFAGNHIKTVVIPSSVKVIASSAFDSNTIRLATGGITRRKLVSDGIRVVRIGGGYYPIASYDINERQSVVYLSRPGKILQETYTVSKELPRPNVDLAVDVGSGEIMLRPRSEPIPINVAPNVDVGIVRTPIKLDPNSGIGDLAYSNAGLTAIVIPREAKYIGYGAFMSNNMAGVAIPPSVRWIGSQAFIGNPISSITIGENVAVQYDSFRYQFADYYRLNNYRAGTYFLKSGHWNYEGREIPSNVIIELEDW
jgi:hypothetical protein